MGATTEASKRYILDTIDGYKNKAHPGFPVTSLPLSVGPALRALTSDGTVRLIDVTKPSKVNPAAKVTYTYVTR